MPGHSDLWGNFNTLFEIGIEIYRLMAQTASAAGQSKDAAVEKIADGVLLMSNNKDDGLMFGMNERDKRLLNFYRAGNTLADLPFTHAELSAIFHMALDRGKENIEDEQQRKAVDGIIGALDTMLFSDDGRDAAELELDNELDEGVEQ